MVKTENGRFEQKLIKVDRPSMNNLLKSDWRSLLKVENLVLRIPTLAIHLDRQETFSFNKETQLFPIAGLVAAELDRQGKTDEVANANTPDSETSPDGFSPLNTPIDRHHPYIVELIAKEAGVSSSSVVDFEIILYDTHQSTIGGLNDELIFSARLDNLEMSYCAVEGLINSVSTSSLANEPNIRLISLFDHEEIGSTTAQGADSNLLPAVIRRLSVLSASDRASVSADLIDTATAYEQTVSSSFLISADMAHSVNPNYSAKYEPDHKPEMNKGTVIKINANSRYATNSPGIVLLQEIAHRAEVPLQLFVVRNDSSCGSTIGPMLSATLGTRTLDLGNAQMSMHSIRETSGVYDVAYGIKLFQSFFTHFSELEGKILVD